MPSSGKWCRVDGGDKFLRNVDSYKIYTTPHPRRWHSSQSPLWKPQILHQFFFFVPCSRKGQYMHYTFKFISRVYFFLLIPDSTYLVFHHLVLVCILYVCVYTLWLDKIPEQLFRKYSDETGIYKITSPQCLSLPSSSFFWVFWIKIVYNSQLQHVCHMFYPSHLSFFHYQ
jgi:hypothetical protein